MSDVVVRLTEAQRGTIRSLLSITVDSGDDAHHGPTIQRALDAVDNALPVLTRSQAAALAAAVALADAEWEGEALNHRRVVLDRAHARVRYVMAP